MWVPGTLPPGLTERAIEAAWPGTHTITSAASAPLPPGALTEGGALRLARPEILPLSVSHDPDAPLRALAGAAAGLGDGEHAIVQVLARPVTGARLRRARRAARAQRAGQPARLPVRLLDLASPGGHASSGTRRTASRTDPELAAEIRAATEKLASPQWETLIRYGVATTAAQIPDGAGRWQARAATAQANARLRGLAHALASATALYTGRNWLARRHLRHPAEAISTRRLPRGDLLSVPELAAIARLPADPALPGLARAGARAVAPPPAIPLPGPDVRPLGVSRHRHAPPGWPGRRRRPSPPADLRADRNRQDHPDRRADPVRCHGRARRGVHRPQRRRRHRHHRPPPRAGGGQGGAVRPRGPRRAALPERPARRRVRHRHRRDHRQRHRDLPPHLRRQLGAAHRRHFPRRLPDPARLGTARFRPGHPRRYPRPARRRRLPPPADRRGPRPGAARLLGLVRAAVGPHPGALHRPADEQAPRVPAPQVRPAGHRRRAVHLRHGRRPGPRRAVPGPAAQRASSARRPRSWSARSSSRAPGRPRPAGPASPRPPGPTPACTSTRRRTS